MGTDDPRRSAADLVGEDLLAGQLVRILPEALALEASAFAIYPQSRHPSPKVRALVDYLAEALGPEPEWDGFETALRARRGRPPRQLRGERGQIGRTHS